MELSNFILLLVTGYLVLRKPDKESIAYVLYEDWTLSVVRRQTP